MPITDIHVYWRKILAQTLASRWQNGHPATNKQVKVHLGRTHAEELAPLKKKKTLSPICH